MKMTDNNPKRPTTPRRERKSKSDPSPTQHAGFLNPMGTARGTSTMSKKKQKSKTRPSERCVVAGSRRSSEACSGRSLPDAPCRDCLLGWHAAGEVHLANCALVRVVDSEEDTDRYQPCMRGGAGKTVGIVHGVRKWRKRPSMVSYSAAWCGRQRASQGRWKWPIESV